MQSLENPGGLGSSKFRILGVFYPTPKHESEQFPAVLNAPGVPQNPRVCEESERSSKSLIEGPVRRASGSDLLGHQVLLILQAAELVLIGLDHGRAVGFDEARDQLLDLALGSL